MNYRLTKDERAAIFPPPTTVAEYLANRGAPTGPSRDLTLWISTLAWQHHHYLDDPGVRELSAMAYAGLEA